MTVVSPGSTPPPTLSRRDRLLLISAISMLVVAVSIFSGLYLLSRPRSAHRHTGPIWINPASDKELAATFEKSKWLRERFAVWGKAHRADLEALRHCAPGDEATLQRVYNALPAYPNPLSIRA